MQICNAMQDDLLPTKAVAEMFGCTVATINRWASEGRLIPAVDMPGRTGARLYRRADIVAFLLARAAERAASQPTEATA